MINKSKNKKWIKKKIKMNERVKEMDLVGLICSTDAQIVVLRI